MEIKYTGMELKLHRHGIRTALASVFGAMLIATPFVGDSALANGIVTGKVSIPNPKNCFSAGSWSCCGFCCAIFLQRLLA